MKITYLVPAVVSALVSTAIAASSASPVCIVGAGPAGLIAAKRLEDKGRSVVVFEKQGSVGGKCQAVYDQ